jgi:ribosomal protein S18 acetylase RimI-like enzyme
MRKNRAKKSKSSNNNNLYSEAFPPDKNGYRPKIISYSPTHDILKEQGQEDIIKIIDPSKIIYKPLNESNMEEIKNLHKEWFPIDYDDNYFKKIFVNKYNTYFSIGAFYTLENNKEIIIGLAFCEYRGVTDYFIKHTSREAIQEICYNIDFNEEVSSYLKCQDYNCVYIMTIGVLDEFRKLNIGSNLIKIIFENAMWDNLCVGVFLDVIDYNKSAIKFYEKNGFKKVSTIKNYYDLKGEFYDSYVFLKIFTRKEKDEFRRKNYSLSKKLVNNLILMPLNAIYKIIIFILFCQCLKNKIKID